MDKIRDATTPEWMKRFNNPQTKPKWAGGEGRAESNMDKPSMYSKKGPVGHAMRTRLRQTGSPGSIFIKPLRREEIKQAMLEMRGKSAMGDE